MTALDVDLSNFNSHAHVERDRFVDRKSARTCHFNSHAHVERDPIITPFPKFSLNFNSHAHVERDVTPSYVAVTSAISTHTLTWSVTGRLCTALDCKPDFNSHAHVERDPNRLLQLRCFVGFQLTRSRGA